LGHAAPHPSPGTAPAATEPSAAERVRSILAAAASVDAVAGGRRTQVYGEFPISSLGHLVIRPADGGTLARAAHPAGSRSISVEITDVAAIAVRDRIRAQVTIYGTLAAPDDLPGGALLMEPACAHLIEGPRYTFVAGGALTDAVPDPVAFMEAEWLLHLATAHPQLVDVLTRLVPPRHLYGVRRVFPLRLDRYGLVLRLESQRTDRDVRLPFERPLCHPGEAAGQLHALLHRAGTCRNRKLRA
jgi:hypothetical protein